jgi:hypothetical protein
MKRVKLGFAAGVEVEFTDRDMAIQQVVEWAGEGTRFPVVVFGPEGCGKTAWLKQSVEALKELGFSVIYFNPLRKEFLAEVGVKSVEEKALEALKQASSLHALAGLVGYVIDFAVEAIKLGRGRLAVMVDDAFQLIDVREAAFIVKGLLEVIEYPPKSYERVVAIAATSEGMSRGEIGRHRWALLRPMWNMGREGFKELHEKLPSPKPPMDEAWRLTGGNPDMLAKLYGAKWDADAVVKDLADFKKLNAFTPSLSADERRWLLEAVEDPDTLLTRERMQLLNKLVELNLVIDAIPEREPRRWIDEPPPEKDLELGVGRHVAWQTPLHREAVRRALEGRR